MKTKCEPGDVLKFPNGLEYVFVGYLDEETALIIERCGDNPKLHATCKCCTPKLHATCKCCTPKLHELIVTGSPAHSPAGPQKIGPESP